MLYTPTAEELITDIFRAHVTSYRDLPLTMYQIQWKFRDEIRPRFGVMRGREFLMKDNYSFDLDFEGAKKSYNKMFVSYLRTFARLCLQAIPMAADTGPIGGDLSHEFIILADTGESEVFCHRDFVDFDVLGAGIDYESDLEPVVEAWTKLYARTDDKHDPAAFENQVPEDKRVHRRGIEVGHIFYFGTKYSDAMGATVTGPNDEAIALEMGSYGIGVSRLVGALIEAHHDDAGIIWPDAVAPFGAGVLNLKAGDDACDAACEDLYHRLSDAGIDPLLDDRAERAGAKFADMDLIGLPWQVIVGPKSAATGEVELKRRATGERETLTVDAALNRLTAG